MSQVVCARLTSQVIRAFVRRLIVKLVHAMTMMNRITLSIRRRWSSHRVVDDIIPDALEDRLDPRTADNLSASLMFVGVGHICVYRCVRHLVASFVGKGVADEETGT